MGPALPTEAVWEILQLGLRTDNDELLRASVVTYRSISRSHLLVETQPPPVQLSGSTCGRAEEMLPCDRCDRGSCPARPLAPYRQENGYAPPAGTLPTSRWPPTIGQDPVQEGPCPDIARPVARSDLLWQQSVGRRRDFDSRWRQGLQLYLVHLPAAQPGI